ncbi:unnamed protein product [Peniophora sp. CBMAI 1063]|nr:unnamed protein product [Peniophora sp. CBMAI 1063]
MILSVLRKHLPNLRDLTIHTYSAAHSRDSANLLPADFLSQIAPSIFYMRVHNIGFPMGSSTALRFLVLSRNLDSNRDAPSPTPYTLAEVLLTSRQLPTLEFLYLRHILPSEMIAESAFNQSIQLPHLKKLVVSDVEPVCVDLCFLLDIHSTAEVSVALTPDRLHVSAHSIERLWRKLGDPLRVCVGDAELTFTSIEFMLGDNAPSSSIFRLGDAGTKPIAISHDHDYLHYSPRTVALTLFTRERSLWKEIILPATPLSLVKHLRFGTTMFPRPAEDIQVMLQATKSVTSLTLVGASAHPTMSCLAPSGPDGMLLPKLQELRLEDVSCNSIPPTGDVSTTVIEELNYALDRRYQHHGWSLSSLTFQGCEIDTPSLEELRVAGRWGGRTRVDRITEIV